MANWTLKGELGSGKSVTAAWKIMQHMEKVLPVATNMDLYPENYLPLVSRATHVRLPDFPSADDFWNLGLASNSRNETTFGLVALDELAVFLNSRDWQGRDREKVIKFLRHIRKLHWHTLFLTQDIESLDKQARNALIEHVVQCKRTDRLSIPMIGWFLRLLGFSGRLPQVHWGIVRYGKQDFSPKVDTWLHRGTKLYEVYNTDQVYTDEEERDVELVGYEVVKNEKGKLKRVPKLIPAKATGSYTVLSPWHLKGRYMNFYQRNRKALNGLMVAGIFCSIGVSYFMHKEELMPSKNKLHQQVTSSESIKGAFESYDKTIVTTSSGLVLEVQESKTDSTGTYYRAGDTWYKKPTK